jgi:subtilisin family serine protease
MPPQSKSWIFSRLGIGFLTIVLVMVIVLRPSNPAGAQADIGNDEPFPVVVLPEEALQAPQSLGSASSAQTADRKMDHVLAEAADSAQISAQALTDIIEQTTLRVEQGKVQVKVIAAAGQQDQAAQAVIAVGGEVSYQSDFEPVLQAWIPAAELDAVAGNPAVVFLRHPSYLVEQETENLSAQTEGLAALNGNAWHNAGYRGFGVKVAIIDGGFSGYRSLLGSNLPADVTAKNFVDGENDSQVDGTSPHGTACAEITADIAPQAKLYLIKISTDLDLEQAVDYAISQGVDVISTSVGWYNLTPGDGTGYFANLVDQARNAGITWVTAAGNDRETHWGGLFFDPDFDSFHNFSGSQEVNYFGPGTAGTAYAINPGFPLLVFLRWDDWSAVNQDYTLYVVRWNGSTWQIVGSSDRPQSGGPGQSPTEGVFIITSGASAPYGFIVQRNSGNRNVNLEIFTPRMPRLDKLVTDRSLSNLADAANVLTIGALNSSSPYAHESYSAQGPTNGPGGSVSGGLIKPDFAGYARVSTESYGSGVFAGTSAAAPHAAGAAALVKDAYSAYSPQDIENFLAGRAVDMGFLGMDNVYGYGRLNLGADPTAGLNNKNYLPMILR